MNLNAVAEEARFGEAEVAAWNAALAEKLAKGDFAKGDFENWAIENMPGIIQTMCKFVFFGLTDDGHFVAYIPHSWEFLHFDTILTPGDPKYGHLIMYY